ncbi:MAG: glycogen/starch synthase, partial [Candidatus Omnitrophica bacterium]|nr:glycogen/starch synthase [Candidatus Omnitrophota bacterium]
KTPRVSSPTGRIHVQFVKLRMSTPAGHLKIEASVQVPRAFIYLHSNVTGVWDESNDVSHKMDFRRRENGHYIFDITVNAQQDFEYTFKYIDPVAGLVWVDLPEGHNAYVHVERPFKGEVAMIAMEMKPLNKSGGQGDVTRELLETFAKKDVRSLMIMPLYRARKSEFTKLGINIDDPASYVPGFEHVIRFANTRSEVIRAKAVKLANLNSTIYVLESLNPQLFDKPYGEQHHPQSLNKKWTEFYESILLSRGALALLHHLNVIPQIIHTHDHHTALIPLLMKTEYRSLFAQTGSQFTIHNGMYQGDYDASWYSELGLTGMTAVEEAKLKELIITHGRLNMMAMVIAVSRIFGARGYGVNSVSNTYAREIARNVMGNRLTWASMGNRYFGVQNGIDFDLNNPSTDKTIFQRYTIDRGLASVQRGRAKNKLFLKRLLSVVRDPNDLLTYGGITPENINNVYGGLKPARSRMLVGFVARFEDQKQPDIIAQMIRDILEQKKEDVGFDLAIFGAGTLTDVADELKELATATLSLPKGQISVAFVNAFTSKPSLVFAGVDAFLVPSKFEPCGITQFLSMRYGAVPIVRETGGLADTVTEGKIKKGFEVNGVWVESADDENNSPESTILPGEKVDGLWTGFTWKGVDDTNPKRRLINADEQYEAIRRAAMIYFSKREIWWQIVKAGMLENNDWETQIQKYFNVYNRAADELRTAESNLLLPGSSSAVLRAVGRIMAVLPMFMFAGLTMISIGMPISFSQERLGYKGHRIKIWKFRTLPNEIEISQRRRTDLGRIIRPFGFDEIFQIFNIIKGDMVWFGPRPRFENDIRTMSPAPDEYFAEVVDKDRPGIFSWIAVLKHTME